MLTAQFHSLSFLSPDGAISVTLSAELSAEQSKTLYDGIRDCESQQEMVDWISIIAKEWGIKVTVDDDE
jgi:hypothetical protein